MSSEEWADKILLWFGTDPTQFNTPDKWPAVIVEFFFRLLPIVFFLLLIAPFIWIWFKKKRQYTLKNIGIALAQSVGLIIAGLVALFLLAMLLQGLAFCELYGC